MTKLRLTALVCLSSACSGTIDGLDQGPEEGTSDPASGAPTPPPGTSPSVLPGPELAAASRLRGLTVDEYNRTVLDLLGDRADASQTLAEDARTPFDNDFGDYQSRPIDSKLIGGVELLAGDMASRLLADKPRRDRVVGCPAADVAGVTDARATACLKQFIARFGRLAWRRTLGAEDTQALMAAGQRLARQDNNFYSAVDGVIRTVLQDPEFLFRIEEGSPVPGAPGIFKLTGNEIAARLSYFLWGSTPDDGLIALAEGGGLDTSEKVRRAAADMLDRPAARARIQRFHALWMGYERPPSSSLAGAMSAETQHLMARVIFDKRLPWQELLRSQDTYVTFDLAQHYGMTVPPTLKKSSTRADWVSYAGTKRQGLLSHATFLQLGVKSGDTHPVLRGKGIRERLFCEVLAKPPNVKAGAPSTTPSPCKEDELRAHGAQACAVGCHSQMDGVGFGLESYDQVGKYRASEWRRKNPDPTLFSMPADPGSSGAIECKIRGEGDLGGKKFNGPGELANLVLASPDLNRCVAEQVYRFAMGRSDIDATDRPFLDLMSGRLGGGDFRFDQLLLDFVSSGAFSHRREE